MRLYIVDLGKDEANGTLKLGFASQPDGAVRWSTRTIAERDLDTFRFGTTIANPNGYGPRGQATDFLIEERPTGDFVISAEVSL